MRTIQVLVAGVLLFTGALFAGEKKLMHCFAFTVIDTATPAQWQAFMKATDEIPNKIPGVTKVWHGKLRSALSVYDEDSKTMTKRQHGVCMEMNDAATLTRYAADPYHKEWMAIYEKVRVAGTTTFDILGE
jgi:Stress responsive A/B Barrel Domain